MPCAGKDNAASTEPRKRKPVPTNAKYLALVLEKLATNKIAVNGPNSHQGTEPSPPGFESSARLGPPPASAKPGSNRNLDGCSNASVLNGVLIRNGIESNKRRSLILDIQIALVV